jgi:hypothetical protein
MWRRIREPFGTAGLIVAIVALVAALAGGAYAASGALTGKQKKEVQKIAQTEAKKFAGKQGPTGSTGSTGAQGATGAKGDTGTVGTAGPNGPGGEPGAKGERGEQGVRGPAGASPEVVELPVDPSAAECKAGGAKIIGVAGEEASVCNGEGGGSGGGYPETLPSGKTETGLWEVQGENGLVGESGGFEYAITVLSYPLRLAAPPTETLLVNPSTANPEEVTKCPGTIAEPEAGTAGVLCLYSKGNFAEEPLLLLVGGTLTTGAELIFAEPAKAVATGSWAIKAP